jgi:hypothetical protein
MALSDRVRRREAEKRRQQELMAVESQTDSPVSSSLAVVDDNPTIDRLRGVIRMLRNAIEENDDGSGMARFAFLITTFTDELAEEFRDIDEVRMRLYMFQVGEMISWIGHGDNERLPDSIRGFADLIQPPVAVPDAEAENAGSHPELDPATR